MTEAQEKKDWERGFTQGYICCAATFLGAHGEDSYVEEMIKALGVTFIAECRKSGVDDQDIETLRPIFKEIQRKARLK